MYNKGEVGAMESKSAIEVFFNYEDEIVNPCWDNVFKAIFTKDAAQSRGALQELLSAIVGRDLAVVTITANEPPVDRPKERQIRYDINCRFSDNELCDIEMTLKPDIFEPCRMEYYLSKLYCSQDIRGKDKAYGDLQHAYQVSFLVETPVINDENYLHHFSYYDVERMASLDGKTHIITIELSKLELVESKPVAEMSTLDRWAMFFKHAENRDKRSLVNELIMNEEGIKMAGEVLLAFSRDEIERARLVSEYKHEVDLQSHIVNAKREGRAEGVRNIAVSMLESGEDVEKIIRFTGLTREQVESLSIDC